MAVASPSSTEILDPKLEKPDTSTENPNPVTDSAPSRSENTNPNPEPGNTDPIPTPNLVTPPPPPPPQSFAPSFRPLGVAPVPQYSAVPNPSPNYPQSYVQNPNPIMQPPGVSAQVSYMMPGVASGAGSVSISLPPMRPAMYQPPPMLYGQPPNGYMPIPPPGIPRYPGPYPIMARPGYPPRPLLPMGVIPQMPRPPIPGVRGILPMVSPAVRPAIPPATEKPHTTVYVGKIAPTVGNEFMLSILRLCGPVKSWKRAQDPTHGSLVSFGFCEFEAAEGILRALRLLPKLNIDGQELVININTNTREYLERYVEKKAEREKLKGTESQTVDKENEGEPGAEKQEAPKPEAEDTKKDKENSEDKENRENQNFGIVTDEDREADKDALERITAIIEERLKTHPLPPPPPVLPADASAKSNSEVPSKSKDGDSDVDIMRSDAAEDKNDDEITSETRPATEHDRPETSSPERGRRHDRSSRERDRGERDRGERDREERDRERDLKREKERNLERFERERERERIRKERERDQKIREAERLYNNRLKEWEARERDKEHQRQKEKEREKERLRERRREIMRDEDGSDDDEEDSRKRRRRSSLLEDRRRKRQREKEDDLTDRLEEEEEIAEAKKRAVEEQKQIAEVKSLPIQVTEENENDVMQEDPVVEDREADVVQQPYVDSSIDAGDIHSRNGIGGELNLESAGVPDVKQSNEAPARKLGFGLIGSGRRATVPSVFHEEDDENVDEKKMRPLVPIDYSTEELQAVQTSVSSAPANLVAAAEFAKRISSVNPKEEKVELERGRNGRPSDKSSHRERDRNDDVKTHYKNEIKEKTHDRSSEREREREDTPKSDNKNLLNAKAKQLIDTIPKTKEELFAYEINWAIYDKHELHERMRPWISKKITEFLGEEEATLVDYIVSSTKDHVRASKMLELLQSILDDEAEMFVLKMWRMLIFEIKKVETGLPVKSRA